MSPYPFEFQEFVAPEATTTTTSATLAALLDKLPNLHVTYDLNMTARASKKIILSKKQRSVALS